VEGAFASPVRFPPVPYVVRVEDATRDHLAVVRQVPVPAAAPVEVALPRSVRAPIPAGTLTVVASIVTEAGQPAAWAVLGLSAGGYTTGGVADDRGAVLVPYPRAVPPTALGTPGSGPLWRVTVRVRYRPADQFGAPGADAGDPPVLTSVLTQQPALVDDAGVFAGSLQRDLTTGGPLVVSSRAAPAPAVLVVRTAP